MKVTLTAQSEIAYKEIQRLPPKQKINNSRETIQLFWVIELREPPGGLYITTTPGNSQRRVGCGPVAAAGCKVDLRGETRF